MSWIFAASADEPEANSAIAAVPERLPSGSLVMLVDPSLAFVMPGLPLLHAAAPGPEPRALSVVLLDDGRLHLMHRRGDSRGALAVTLADMAEAPAARITYGWDARTGRHFLSAENLSSGGVALSAAAGATGLARQDVLDLCIDRRRTFAHPALLSLAIGTGVATVGQTGGIAAGTPVATPDGPVPVGRIRPGDTVLSGDGRARRVLAVTVDRSPALGPLRPVRLLAPYFGRKEDIVVDPRQKVLIAGPDVEYLFECEAVLAEARALADGTTAQRADDDPWAEWHGLVFDEHDTFLADGCRMDGRFVGRIAASPDIVARSSLAGLAAADALPVHAARCHRVLAPWEATALSEMRRRRRAPVAA
ncbi:MAG: Hint domain-containing protein [Rhodobacteraceae bacterium]|nr:Hint domain-containing protein [Paracoccaceae bacterium]